MIESTRRFRSAPWLLALIVLVSAFAMSCAGGGRRTSSAEIRDAALPSSEAAGTALRIFATGDGRGHLEPCGCEKDQTGGLPRRGSYLASLRRDRDLLVDLGNLTSGKDRLREARRTSSFDALVALRYDVLVPGPAETFDGEAFISAAAERPQVKVVCANWSRAGAGRIFDPYVIRTASNGKRVAFIGVTEPFADESKDFVVAPPAQALREVIAELAGKADAFVVGAAMSTTAAESLAREVRGVALVLVGATPDNEQWTAAPGGARIEVAGDLGSYVTRVDLAPDLTVRDAWKAWLDDKTPEDPAMTALVQRYRDTITSFDVDYVKGVVESHRASGFAGSESCVSCHPSDAKAWHASLHSHAMKILVEKKSSRDPDCVPCHLVDVDAPAAAGAGAAAGAASESSFDDLGVGCEACHGASGAHVLSAQAGSLKPAPTPQRDPKSTCVACHHPPFVKVFALDTHWPKIQHGRGAAK